MKQNGRQKKAKNNKMATQNFISVCTHHWFYVVCIRNVSSHHHNHSHRLWADHIGIKTFMKLLVNFLLSQAGCCKFVASQTCSLELFFSNLSLEPRVSNRKGQCNFSGQRDKLKILPRDRTGRESQSKSGTGRVGWDKVRNSSWIRIKRGLVVNNYLRETWSPLWLSLDLKEEGSHFAYMMGRTSWANRDFLLVNLPFIGIFQHKNLWPWSLWLCSTVPDCTAGLRKTFPDCNLEIINHWFIYFLSLLMSKMHTAESYQISRFDTEREKWIFFKAGLSK